MELRTYLDQQRKLINQYLDQHLPLADQYPPTIHEAMRYSVFAGGKRVRSILALAATEAVGGDAKVVLPVACALELIHTYSLVHDDLPAMDDDDLRRGKPTCHKVFGEATAILTGDALLTMAFELLTSPSLALKITPIKQLEIIRRISQAVGSYGLIGGQVMDIESEGKQIDAPQLEYIHTHKTGCLIRVSVIAGGMAADCSEEHLNSLSHYGEKVGLAYQIMDDILDVEGESEEIGKNPGSDTALGKATYPAMWGIKQAKNQARDLISDTQQDLAPLGEQAYRLGELARFIVKRHS